MESQSDTIIDAVLKPEPTGLRDTRSAPEEYRTEKPWHRMAAHLAAGGYMSQREIADACGKSEGAVSELYKQRWFRQQVADLINSKDLTGSTDAMLRAAAPGAILRIVDMAETATNEGVKLRANQDLLDRALGKAPINFTQKVSKMTPEEEFAYLEKEIARLSQQKTI